MVNYIYLKIVLLKTKSVKIMGTKDKFSHCRKKPKIKSKNKNLVHCTFEQKAVETIVTRRDLALIWKNKKKGEKKKRKEKKNGSYHFEFSTQNEKLVVHASAPRRTSVCDKLTKKKNTLINIQSERFPRGTKIVVSEPTKKI